MTLRHLQNCSDKPALKTPEEIKTVTLKLLSYCQSNDWKGYDPYDALSSRAFVLMPLLDRRIFRILFSQLIRRLPFNLRPLLRVPREENPKAIALFLTAFLKLSGIGLLNQEALIEKMIEKLEVLRSQNTPYWCWGYNFPWQTREILVPRGTPNLVCTYFVANALLDAYEKYRAFRYLSMAASAAEYILNEFYWTKGNSIACFSYFRYPPPLSPHQVHNVNFLGAALLCRIYKHCRDRRFLEPALKVAKYSAAKQQDDGSWNYGEHPTHRWIDNFHTGYNLCALRNISKDAETSEFEPHICRGFEFYRKNFFRQDGAPKYFNNRTYPVDTHGVAQSIITLLTFKDLDENNLSLVHSVLRWTITNLWNEQGYFYYQVFPIFTSRISYMRWAQAWMLLALSILLEYYNENPDRRPGEANPFY